MSDTDRAVAADHADDHDTGHGHEDAAEPLGPVDVQGWLAAIGGGALGVVVVIAMYVAGQG